MNAFPEIDWSQVADEDIPCSEHGVGFENKNLWLHPSGEVRKYSDWWYLDSDGFPVNAVDQGLLVELKGTEEIAACIDAQLGRAGHDYGTC